MKRTLFAFLAVLTASSSFAFSPDIAGIESVWVDERYPVSAKWNPSEAERVLDEVAAARKYSEELTAYSKSRCLENFFANSCADDVRKARMRAEKRFLRIETQAKAIVREQKNRENEQRQRERDEKYAKGPSGARVTAESNGQPVTKVTEHAKKRKKQVEERKKMMAEKKAQESEHLAAYEKRLADQKVREAKREQALKKRQRKKEENAKKHPNA